MTELETLSAMLDGDLGVAETQALHARLEAEPELAKLFEDLTAFSEALSTYPEATPPLALNAAVLGASAGGALGLGGWLALGLIGLVLSGGFIALRSAGPLVSPEASAPVVALETESTPAPSPVGIPAVRRVRTAVPARRVTEAECADFEALSRAAIEGFLSVEQQACLEGYRLGDDLETAAFASDLLLVQAWAADDKETWRALAVDHVSAIEPERVVLMQKLAIDAYKADDYAIALATAEDALALSDAFDPIDRDGSLSVLHRIRVAAMVKLDKPVDQVWDAASEWFAHNQEADLDTVDAERVCVTYGSSCAD
ncbi:MAG: hypothetical protein KC912_20635 [Proteobacteria bacterium]|nr:hypothetical protein [Pseudomonadota bacterium]